MTSLWNIPLISLIGVEEKIVARSNLNYMETEQEIQFAVETLTAIMRHEHRRLATGAALRTYIHKQLLLGNQPSHYRMDWLRRGINSMIYLLGDLAETFNRENENDKVSVGDFLDILDSTSRTLRARTGYTDAD